MPYSCKSSGANQHSSVGGPLLPLPEIACFAITLLPVTSKLVEPSNEALTNPASRRSPTLRSSKSPPNDWSSNSDFEPSTCVIAFWSIAALIVSLASGRDLRHTILSCEESIQGLQMLSISRLTVYACACSVNVEPCGLCCNAAVRLSEESKFTSLLA